MFYVISVPNVLFYVFFLMLPIHLSDLLSSLNMNTTRSLSSSSRDFSIAPFTDSILPDEHFIWPLFSFEIRLTGNLKGLTVNDPIKYFKLIHQVSGVADKVSIPDIWCQSLNIPWIVIHSNSILMSIAPEETKRWEELDFVLLSSELLILRWHKQDSWHFIIVDTS